MFLRSPWAASTISDPRKALTIDAFRDAGGDDIPTPIPLDRFVSYGRWFQQQAVPDVDRRRILRIDRDGQRFRLTLNDGSELTARRVVIAGGIQSFARRPKEFENLPVELVTHASDQRNVAQFKGRDVVVIGAGQSALEWSALLHEAGASVEVIARAPSVHWLGWRVRLQKLGPVAKLLYSPHDIGPAGVSRIVAVPDVLPYFPRSLQDRFRMRALRPAGARWLKGRCENVVINTGRAVASATPLNGKLQIKLDDGSHRAIDHVILGTGYRVDVSKYPFLPPDLSCDLKQVNGFPKLGNGFESSIPGLHFMGAPSAWNFGPLMYFVCGTDYAAKRLGAYFAGLQSRNGHQ